MEMLHIAGIPLPDILVVKGKAEISQAKELGIPYVVWSGSHEQLVKHLLLPALEKLFPSIDWDRFLKLSGKEQILVHVPGDNGTEDFESMDKGTHEDIGVQEDDGWSDIADNTRTIKSAGFECECLVDLDDYCGDATAQVNVEQLQALQLLPSFMDDIATNVRKNLFTGTWTEGYNKKLSVPIGNFNAGTEADNLIILDISHSIPLGIANTMIVLLETLRSQTNAHVIITSARSGYYAPGETLPTAEEIRRKYGRSNESDQFFEIIIDKVLGKHWGNVISFGDNDTPYLDYCYREQWNKAMAGTKVDKVWHYHTKYPTQTGYARWASDFADQEVYNTDWCTYMGKNEIWSY